MATKADAARRAASAEADLIRLRPSETMAEDVRKADARAAEALSEFTRRLDDECTIREILPEMHRRAADLIRDAANAALQDRRRELLAERKRAAGALCEAAAEQVEALGVAVFGLYEIQESGHLWPQAAIFQTIGHPPPAAPARADRKASGGADADDLD